MGYGSIHDAADAHVEVTSQRSQQQQQQTPRRGVIFVSVGLALCAGAAVVHSTGRAGGAHTTSALHTSVPSSASKITPPEVTAAVFANPDYTKTAPLQQDTGLR